MVMKQYRFIIRTLLVAILLLAGGAAHEAWATDVTYHILTLPIDNSIYHMTSTVSGKRLEAFTAEPQQLLRKQRLLVPKPIITWFTNTTQPTPLPSSTAR